MDTFVDSSWYYLRYLDPANDQRAVRPGRRGASGLPVDQYIGGIEHAILHLLYARFFARVMKDLGLVDIRGAVRGALQPGDDHAACPRRASREDVEVARQRGLARPADRAKGADAVRAYVLFLGPPEKDAEWSDEGIARPGAIPRPRPGARRALLATARRRAGRAGRGRHAGRARAPHAVKS